MSFFRNVSLFRFPARIADQFDDLQTKLAKHALRPCGSVVMQTRGWVSPYGRGDETLVVDHGRFTLLALGGEDKILPKAIINQRTADKVTAIETQRGQPVGGRERRQLKDEALTELLPRALAKPSRLAGYLDMQDGWLVVDSASRKAAEGFVSELRNAIGSFPAVGIDPEESPRALMTNWIGGHDMPDGFNMGDACVMADPVAGGAIVRCRRQDLWANEIREHLASGKKVTQMSLTFEDRISFVLDETLTLRKVKFLELATQALENNDLYNAKAELDARFALMAGEFSRLFSALQNAFGIGDVS
jgi:recombination associated protein RdgC